MRRDGVARASPAALVALRGSNACPAVATGRASNSISSDALGGFSTRARARGTSGVARRTPSGARGRDGAAISGASSTAAPRRPKTSVRLVDEGLVLVCGGGKRGRSAATPWGSGAPRMRSRSKAGLGSSNSRSRVMSRAAGLDGASENSYPQFRQRSPLSNPRYPHFGHFIIQSPALSAPPRRLVAGRRAVRAG